MAKTFVNLGRLESKSTTFRFPYSRSKNYLEPEFIPKDKIKAELLIGMYFCQLHMLNLKHNVEGVRVNTDDSNKKGDIIVTQEGKDISIQITRLTFTDFETRRSISKKKSIEFAKLISDRVRVERQIVINIFPKNKHKIPLKNMGSRAKTLERKLIELIVLSLSMHKQKLNEDITHIAIDIKDGDLRNHFYSVDLCPIPQEMYPNVYGFGNVFINYNFYGSTYDNLDADKAINDVFKKKEQGSADILLIWANSFELHDLDGIVDKLRERFASSSFASVQFMTFHDNVALFRETLRLWGIKPLTDVVK